MSTPLIEKLFYIPCKRHYVASGSFVHDVDLKIKDWIPNKQELMVFSAFMHKMAEKELPFERLEVTQEFALKMFQDNQYKLAQIPSIAKSSPTGDTVILYRLGDHVNVSKGPMVGNSSFLGRRCTITSAHQIVRDDIPLYRFQGVALPKDIFLNHFAYGILEKRATILNPVYLKTNKKTQDNKTESNVSE